MTRRDDLTTPFDAYLRHLRPVTEKAIAEAAEHRARLVYLERAQRDALIAQEDAAQDRGTEG